MLDDLIAQATALKSEPHGSPLIALWRQRARAFIKATYGAEYVKILNHTLFSRRAATSDAQANDMHREAMDRATKFLNGLRVESPLQVPDDAEHSTGLHPAIQERCVPLFNDGHYPEAVELSFKIVRSRLRELTGFETGSEAFGRGSLHIAGAAALHVDKAFNEGVKFLTMAIDNFRNEKSHTSDGHSTDPDRAREYLSMSSLAMHLLNQAEISE